HELAPPARHVLLLTGTPIRNTAEDLYTQVEIVQPGTWSSFHDFERRHLEVTALRVGARTQRIVRGQKNTVDLQRTLATLKIQRKKGDVLHLPPKLHTFPEIELGTGVFRRLYNAMRDLAIYELSALEPGL